MIPPRCTAFLLYLYNSYKIYKQAHNRKLLLIKSVSETSFRLKSLDTFSVLPIPFSKSMNEINYTGNIHTRAKTYNTELEIYLLKYETLTAEILK